MNTNIYISDFFPKYPNVKNKDNDFLNPYNDDFSKVIYQKREFYENRLKSIENKPENRGEQLSHQKNISRFISERTGYNNLLIFHEMGTGKTCTAIGITEQIRSNKNSGYKHTLYISKGESLHDNFINELLFKCTDGRYIPEGYDQLSQLEKSHRSNKIVNEFYSLKTFETFAKLIHGKTNNNLEQEYSNHIIIIDEVHNLRLRETGPSGINTYKEIHRFLHIVKDCKIILMSGTPMKDTVNEIASVFNLITPMNKQLPVEEEFDKLYLEKNNENKFVVKQDKIQELKEHFKGLVSFLKAVKSNVPQVFSGQKIGNLKEFNVVPQYMSDYQSRIYIEAYRSDQTERTGVYSKSRQSSLFLFPDGTYADTGFSKYIVRKTTGRRRETTYKFSARRQFIDTYKGNTPEETITKIEKYSVKYANSLRMILRAQRENKCVFIYNEYVKGSGLIVFSILLELIGFSPASGSEPENSYSPRYTLFTNLTMSTKKIQRVVNRFNQPDNTEGKVINVILGSKKISEGISFFNIQIEEIQTPWFNYGETSQIIARGYRFDSHDMLINQGKSPSLEIIQSVSIPNTSERDSVDLKMYEISEFKDISIKSMERVLKENAWDCGLNYDRNRTGVNNSRDCDYRDCTYTCDYDSNEQEREPEMLDESSYQNYYSEKDVSEIEKEIKNVFRKTFSIQLSEILIMLPQYSIFLILKTLYNMIVEKVSIINKFGFVSYLEEYKNVYFITDNINSKGNITYKYYTQHPIIYNKEIFSDVINKTYIETLPKIIREIDTIQTKEDVILIINRLPINVQEYILETSILAEDRNVNRNRNARGLILDYFKDFYTKFNGTLVSYLLYEESGILRCVDSNGIWINCTDERYSQHIDRMLKSIRDRLEKNPVGYYGQLNFGVSTDENVKFIRKGVSDTPSSFLECVIEAYYENMNDDNENETIQNLRQFRRRFREPSYISVVKQSLYDFSDDEIIDMILNEDVYFDPQYFTDLLETYFKCNIFVFSSKNNKKGELTIPRHINGYYTNKKYDKTILIYENIGSVSDSSPYPRCELILKWDKTTEQQQITYNFNTNEQISSAIIKMFHDINRTYILNNQIKSVLFPIFNPNIEIIEQYIDVYGKSRMIKLNVNSKDCTILCDPTQPITVKHVNEMDIIRFEQREIDTFLNLYRLTKLKQYVNRDNLLIEIKGMIGNVMITIPVKDNILPLPNIQQDNDMSDVISRDTESLFVKFSEYRKQSKYLREYIVWLFSTYLHTNNIRDINDNTMIEFIDQYIQIIPNFEYKQIDKFFSMDSDIMNNNKLVCNSEELVKRLLQYLQLHIYNHREKVMIYHTKTIIDNYYENILDLNSHSSQVLISSEDAFNNFINQYNTKLTVYEDIQPEIQLPYMFRNKYISNKLILIQNSKSLEKAIYIGYIWKNLGYNIGYDFEIAEEIPKYQYTLYAYKNNVDIKKYKINGEENPYNIKIIGYKLENISMFSTIIDL